MDVRSSGLLDGTPDPVTGWATDACRAERARRFQAICRMAATPVFTFGRAQNLKVSGTKAVIGISRYLINERIFNGVDVVEGVALMGLACREFVDRRLRSDNATGPVSRNRKNGSSAPPPCDGLEVDGLPLLAATNTTDVLAVAAGGAPAQVME